MILSVDGDCQFAFTLFLHLPKKKGASGSRDGWYPGLITDSTFKSANSCR